MSKEHSHSTQSFITKEKNPYAGGLGNRYEKGVQNPTTSEAIIRSLVPASF